MQKGPMLSPGDRWESDRGVRVEIRALSMHQVILELVGSGLGRFGMSAQVFQRVFRHLVRPGWRHT